MTLLPKHTISHRDNVLRDVRPASVRIKDFLGKTDTMAALAFMVAAGVIFVPPVRAFADILALFVWWYARWFHKRPVVLPFKMPQYANLPDPHNPSPGKSGAGKSEGILFLGNLDEDDHPDKGRELWLTNSDARTHILFLGTTGSGKTEGLKSLVTNALSWGSGYVYVDGKADTDLWATMYAMARRFGRDDDLLVLNYMTANSDDGATSNTMNPFATGSASYLTNMVTSLMPDAGGDNAMWKERAVALLGALMPALTYKRDKHGLLLDVGVMRDYIELPAIIRLSRDPDLSERIVKGLLGYLNTLPGYVDAAFDDEGNERPPSPDQPMYDLQVARQQHGYLSMQFTRSLQSLADEYGYIFKAQLADIDVLDVVLNRRMLVALIPSLEKSGDEAANLGKIVAASLKGMMGSTLGNAVEGSWDNAIGSKQTRSASSFMTVFDEVGYYTAPGMAVMAAQARSLGFSLIFAAQDLPSMEKRVKQEAQSILGNCNLKIFGKLEDPTDTKKFFEDHVGTSWVMESSGMQAPTNTVASLFMTNPFYDNRGAGSATTRSRASYDHLRKQREGEVHMLFAEFIVKARMFHAVAKRAEALRVNRLLAVPGTTTMTSARDRALNELAARLKDKEWKAATAVAAAPAAPEIAAMAQALLEAKKAETVDWKLGPLALAALEKMPVAVPEAAPALPGAVGPQRASPGSRVAASAETAQTAPVESRPALPRTEIPALQEGDEFAFTELESFAPRAAEATAASSVAVETMALPFAPPLDIDLGVVGRGELVADELADITQVKLPDEIASLLEQSAQKLNRGLSGEGESVKIKAEELV